MPFTARLDDFIGGWLWLCIFAPQQGRHLVLSWAAAVGDFPGEIAKHGGCGGR